MNEIKKYLLYVDINNKQRFVEKDIGEEEKIKIKNFFILKENGMKNPKKLPYIELLKPINQSLWGSVTKFHKVIYFYELDRQKAKIIIINDFRQIYLGRSKETLINLHYLTEKNLKFINDILKPEIRKEGIKKSGVKKSKK